MNGEEKKVIMILLIFLFSLIVNVIYFVFCLFSLFILELSLFWALLCGGKVPRVGLKITDGF